MLIHSHLITLQYLLLTVDLDGQGNPSFAMPCFMDSQGSIKMGVYTYFDIKRKKSREWLGLH